MDELTSLHAHGVFLRREALAAGYSDRDLARERRTGSVARVRHGAYVNGQVWESADDAFRHRLLTHAVVLSHPSGVVASHVSAAALHGLDLWGSDLQRVHVVKPSATGGRRHLGVAYHDTMVGPAQLVDGTAVVSRASAAVGAAMCGSVEAGLVVLDAAYRDGGCSRTDLLEVVEAMAGWPGAARLQITLRLAQPGSESVGESRCRYLFWRYRIPRPHLQYPVYDGTTLVGTADFAWPESGVLGEFDGKVKYRELLRPGQDPSDVVFREKVREDRMREVTGFRFIRITWGDLQRPLATAERVRRALRR